MSDSLKKHKTTIIRDLFTKKNKIENQKINFKHPIIDEKKIDLYNNYISFNKLHKTEINNEKNTEKSLLRVKKAHDIKDQKKIMQRSSDYAHSIYELNNYPYEEFDKSYSKKEQNFINIHNLSRAIKINTINKYLYNLEDDDLLVHNPKKLNEEMMKIQIECNKTNYKTKYNMSFLKKDLKKETIRKFNNIKDSKFGFPV